MADFMRWGLVVGQFRGVALKIHWSCFLALAWYYRNICPEGFRAIDAWFLGIFAATILLHEIGHCMAVFSTGGEAYEIILWPLGGLALFTGGRDTARDWIWVAAAGPLMNVLIAFVCMVLLELNGHPVPLSEYNPFGPWSFPMSSAGIVLYGTFKLQVILVCLNLVPAYPLDGGQILLGYLMAFMNPNQAAATTAVVTMLAAVGMLMLGIDFLPIWLLIEGWGLYHAAHSGPLLLSSPRRNVHRRLDAAAALPRPAVAEEYLRPCPHCQKPIHLKAERCTYCDRLID